MNKEFVAVYNEAIAELEAILLERRKIQYPDWDHYTPKAGGLTIQDGFIIHGCISIPVEALWDMKVRQSYLEQVRIEEEKYLDKRRKGEERE